jgi:hypothetical protein
LYRISRRELHSLESFPPSSPDPTLTDLFRTRIASQEISYAVPDLVQDGISDDGSETELRLFAGAGATTHTQKIKVASPEPGSYEPGFIVHRPRSYYFADALTERERKEFEAVAVTGETVKAWSKEPWPGCALPWKVRTITKDGLKKVVLIGHPREVIEQTEVTKKKRTRPSKKSRIARHKKAQALSSKAEEEKRKVLEREQAEREKRTKRNREKKVKKKAKEKARKLEASAAAGTGEPEGDIERMSVG